MSLFRRKEHERAALASRDLARELEAPCPRCSANVLETGEIAEPEGDCWRYVCGECGQVSRWSFADAVPMLVRDP